jgi:hypothetical protein
MDEEDNGDYSGKLTMHDRPAVIDLPSRMAHHTARAANDWLAQRYLAVVSLATGWRIA